MFNEDDIRFLKACGIAVDEPVIYELDDSHYTYEQALAVLDAAMRHKQQPVWLRLEHDAISDATGLTDSDAAI